MSASPLISIRGLNHSFGKGALRKQILFDITTEILQGEIVIVTGPSGSGKTTMLTLVGALRSAQAGSVRVLGQELCGAKAWILEKTRKQIGFIFQQHNLLGALSAVQNVELGARVSGKISRLDLRKRSETMLEAVGLGDCMLHHPEQLSGGQRQRVAIARALVGEPAMLLADEPTASLDKQAGREVVERMKYLAREHGTTILLVTHDNRILDIADRIVHLEDGRLSTFTDSVIANNRHMMQMLAQNRKKQAIEELVENLDETGFNQLLSKITDESQQFLAATALASDVAFKGMLARGLSVFTYKLSQLLNAERSSLFLVENDTLLLKVARDLEEGAEIRIPIGSGIAGAAAQSGQIINIPDAYADERFNPDVDKKTGFRTRSVLSLPIKDQRGVVFAVAQLLNRRDGQAFDQNDEDRFASFIESIGVIFETLEGLTSIRPGSGVEK
ncbi:MAG: ATP-binding cassette domain-containing protein [Xanthomonadales bacterium]|nr:ATP-binding cassette domain-containing protein [Xanthomonadales bacterium]